MDICTKTLLAKEERKILKDVLKINFAKTVPETSRGY
jgi:hypothetical protein